MQILSPPSVTRLVDPTIYVFMLHLLSTAEGHSSVLAAAGVMCNGMEW